MNRVQALPFEHIAMQIERFALVKVRIARPNLLLNSFRQVRAKPSEEHRRV